MVQARRASSPVRPPTRRYMYEDHAAADGRLTARSRGAQSSSRRSVSPTSSVSAVSVSRPPSRSLVQAVPTRSPPASVATTVLRPSILGSSSPRLGAQPRLLCKPPGATSLISLRASQVMRRQWQWQRRHRRGLRARRGEAAAWGRCPHPAGRQTPHHRRGALHSLTPHAPLQRSEWARVCWQGAGCESAEGAREPAGAAELGGERNQPGQQHLVRSLCGRLRRCGRGRRSVAAAMRGRPLCARGASKAPTFCLHDGLTLNQDDLHPT